MKRFVQIYLVLVMLSFCSFASADSYISNSETQIIESIQDPYTLKYMSYSSQFEATFYSMSGGVTALGDVLHSSSRIIAVDPNVIPLGSYVYVEFPYAPELNGEYYASDTGGAIIGNIIDVHVPSVDVAYQYGRQVCYITML